AATDGGPVARGELGTAKIRNLTWAGDDFVLAEISRTERLPFEFAVRQHEFYQVAVINAKTSKFYYLFADQQKIVPAVWSEAVSARIDGRWYGFFASYTVDLDHSPDLWRVDLETGQARLSMRAHDDDDEDWVLDAAGNVIAESRYTEGSAVWRLY